VLRLRKGTHRSGVSFACWRVGPIAHVDRETAVSLYVAARAGNSDVVKLLASRPDVLQWYEHFSNDCDGESEREHLTLKLNILLEFRARLNRARFQPGGGESLLLRCNEAMLSQHLDQSAVVANVEHVSPTDARSVGQRSH
jgi:hypothetical protein